MKQEDCFDIDKLEDGEWTPCENCGEIWELNDLREVKNPQHSPHQMFVCPECRDILDASLDDAEEDDD